MEVWPAELPVDALPAAAVLAQGMGGAGVEIKLAVTALVLIGLVLLRWAILRAVTRRVDEAEIWYRARKTATYISVALGVVVLAWLWIEPLGDLGTFLGLVSAGIAIALADVLKNLAGWLYLILRRPYRVDDRIEVDGVAGDVVDIRVFRTSLLEIRNWVDADQSTGRIVHVPNGKVLTCHVSNSTEGFSYVWHEVAVLVTFESDWRRAEEILREAVEEAGGDIETRAAEAIRRASRHYKIRYTHLAPTVYVSVRDSGVLLTGRLLVDARRRRTADQEVWRKLLDGFRAEPAVDLAYPTIRTYLPDALRLRDERSLHRREAER